MGIPHDALSLSEAEQARVPELDPQECISGYVILMHAKHVGLMIFICQCIPMASMPQPILGSLGHRPTNYASILNNKVSLGKMHVSILTTIFFQIS